MNPYWLAVGLASAAPVRPVEASADAAALTLALLPEGEPREWAVCGADDCPPGVGSVDVSEPALALVGSAVEARGRVRTQLAMVGTVDAWVTCSVAPTLREGGLVHAVSRGCRIDRITGVPSLFRSAVVATLEPALAVLLDEQLRSAEAWDLLTAARRGMLGSYSADPSLRSPQADRCVEAIRNVAVRAPGVLVVAVDVGC